jgi:hypothetical protein
VFARRPVPCGQNQNAEITLHEDNSLLRKHNSEAKAHRSGDTTYEAPIKQVARRNQESKRGRLPEIAFCLGERLKRAEFEGLRKDASADQLNAEATHAEAMVPTEKQERLGPREFPSTRGSQFGS